MSYIIDLLTQIGIFGIAAFFIKQIILNSQNKSLEEHKNTLSILHSKQTRLHDRRLEVIEKLYGKLVDLNNAMFQLTTPLKFVEKSFAEHDAELIKEAREKYKSLSTFYQKNRIYFHEKTCEKLDNMLGGFHRAYHDYNEPKLLEAHGVYDRKAREKGLKSFDIVKDEIPEIIKQIEVDFREILVVN